MAKQTINLGTAANDGTGTNLRAAGDMINDNFDELYDGSDKAWINCFKTSTSGSQTVPNGEAEFTPINRAMLIGYYAQNVPSQLVEGSETNIRGTICLNPGKYLLNFDCDILTTEIATVLFAVFGSSNDVMNPAYGYFQTFTYVNLPRAGEMAHCGINAIIEVPETNEGIQIGIQHNFASPIPITFKKATKLTLLYLGV
jgi:hypothetical protein